MTSYESKIYFWTLHVILDLQVRRVLHQNESDFSLHDTQGGNSIKIPAENLYQNG